MACGETGPSIATAVRLVAVVPYTGPGCVTVHRLMEAELTVLAKTSRSRPAGGDPAPHVRVVGSVRGVASQGEIHGMHMHVHMNTKAKMDVLTRAKTLTPCLCVQV